MDKQPEFFSKIIGYVFPIGNAMASKGQEGIYEALMQTYEFGTSKYPKSTDFFRELESTGATFSASANNDFSSIFISVPKVNADRAEELLDHVVNNVETSEESLVKIKDNLKMQLEELLSDDRGYALYTLKNMVTGLCPAVTSSEAIESISLENITKLQSELKTLGRKLTLTGAETYNIENIQTVKTESIEIEESLENIKFLERDLDQKVLTLGLKMNGHTQYDYIKAIVARNVLYNGSLYSLVMQKIREEHSAAYYAYATHYIYSNTGQFNVVAGVSEENIVKALKLMKECLKQMIDGDFENERLEIAKKTAKTDFYQLNDSLPSLASLYSKFLVYGEEVPKYDELVKRIDKVTKEDVVAHYSSFVKAAQLYLVTNGNLKDDIKKECTDIVEEGIN